MGGTNPAPKYRDGAAQLPVAWTMQAASSSASTGFAMKQAAPVRSAGFFRRER